MGSATAENSRENLRASQRIPPDQGCSERHKLNVASVPHRSRKVGVQSRRAHATKLRQRNMSMQIAIAKEARFRVMVVSSAGYRDGDNLQLAPAYLWRWH
jgi:hypothetical protein